MRYKVIYGRDTGSIEDYNQSVVLLIPEDVDDVEEYLDEHHFEDVPQQTIVCLEDVLESLTLILDGRRLHPQTQVEILDALTDALDNND